MLIKCPECDNDISDKAVYCPKCGYVISRKKLYKPKRLRLPNGFGRITKISNKNLRKPYRAMVTVGTDENGRPIGRILKPEGYFKTYNEAYQALMDYRKNPFDIDSDVTLDEIYHKWFDEHVTNGSMSYIRQMRSAWNYCSSMKNESIRSMKPSQIKFIIDNGVRIDSKGNEIPIPLNMKANVKALFLGVFDYALERDLVDRNIAKDVSVGKDTEKKIREARNAHVNFNDDELSILWQHTDDMIIRFVLIQSYSGWRPGELLDLSLENIDLEHQMMTGGNKTENGKNRTVPIHSKIRHLIEENYELAKKYSLKKIAVVDKSDRYIIPSVSTLDRRLKASLNSIGITAEHRPHDGRVTFVTLAKKYSLDEYAIKRIVGHAIDDITEKVYTIRDIEWLRSEIEKIK